jgi:vacuolar-type H+-ATPase subunit H
MGSDAIDTIRQAEKHADETLTGAAQEAERIREGAYVQAQEDDRAARAASEGMAQSILDMARQLANRHDAEAGVALEKELAMLTEQATRNRSNAVGQILRVIVGR